METTPLISYHEAYDHVNKSDLEQFMVKCLVLLNHLNVSQDIQGGHGTGKTGNLVLTFSRQGKHREFCSDTGKNFLTQGKYLDCDY